jgi:hypothetical protein
MRYIKLPLFLLLFAIVSVKGGRAMNVESTAYGKSVFRLEFRPLPTSMETTFKEVEEKLAESGVGARWISVVDPWGSPVYPSNIIPSPYPDAGKQEEILHKWIEVIHSKGLPVMSWYPLIFSEAGWKTHPEWRQVSLLPWPEGKTKEISCCINSGYGDALIELMCEAIGRFKLDGIWFDGSAFTEIWERPLPLTCFCSSCREKFKRDTGFDLPEKVDWNDPVFRRWVAWRFKVFGEFIGKAAREIRRRYPNVAVVVNHYHRPQIPWHSAIPLDIYDADIITGSEATGMDAVDLVMRLCRAYGRAQSEVWRPLDDGDEPEKSPQTNDLLHHALSCYIAGGMPSFGYPGGDFNKVYQTISLISPIMKAIHPYVGGESFPYLAIHISQQSETFYFGRAIDGKGWKLEPFFALLNRWTKELMNLHIPPDYIYDKALTKENLARYKVLLLPLSPALSNQQAESILNFAEKGGIVYLGPGCGELDEWGERRARNPLGEKLGFKFEDIYPPSASEIHQLTIVSPKGVSLTVLTSLYAPIKTLGREWEILFKEQGSNAPSIALRKYGKGYFILSAIDLQAVYPWQPIEGLDTKISPCFENPAEGNACAEFIDAPKAPYNFCPDMEIQNFPAIEDGKYVGGKMSFYIKVKDADAQIEMRNLETGATGVLLHFSSSGHLTVNGKDILNFPLNEWLKVEAQFRFQRESEPGKVDIKILLPDGNVEEWKGLPLLSEGFRRCDWAVIFAPGTKEGRFWIDDVEIYGMKSDGEEVLLFKEDFEGYGKESRPNLCKLLWERIKELSPPPIELRRAEGIRVGTFEKDGVVYLHLHNPRGSWRDFGKDEGENLEILLRFPIKQAFLPLKNNSEVKVKKKGKFSILALPSPALYEIIAVER